MLQPKKVALSILAKYNVNHIDLDGKQVNENLCTIVDTEPDSTKEDGLVVSIEKNGYTRGNLVVQKSLLSETNHRIFRPSHKGGKSHN